MTQTLHTVACDLAKHVLHERGSVPAVFVLARGEHLDVIPAPWADQAEKEYMVGRIRMLLSTNLFDAYSFITEAWQASVDMRINPELANVAPRDRSNREDVLLIITRHRDGKGHATRWVVNYDADGTPRLGPPQQLPHDNLGGFIGNLFEPPKPRPVLRPVDVGDDDED